MGVVPLFVAGGASATCIEGVPGMAAGTAPEVGRPGFPIAFWADDFYFGHDRYCFFKKICGKYKREITEENSGALKARKKAGWREGGRPKIWFAPTAVLFIENHVSCIS